MLLFGRITYELMAGYWPTPGALEALPIVAERMNNLPKAVFSSSLARPYWQHTDVVTGDVGASVERMKREPGPDMVIMGSGTIVAQLTDARLIDTYQIVVIPIVLGRGRTMFEGVEETVGLRPTGTRAFENGNVVLWYEPSRGTAAAWPHDQWTRSEHEGEGIVMADLSFGDRTDFEDADRGFIAKLDPGVVKTGDGRVVWDNDAYAFLDGDCPDTAHPSLWRQGQLVARQGLYEVAEGLYQVRGLDLSNMTLVEGERGVLVIDPLISAETAAAALGLYREHRGDRPVSAVVYTHSHVDHFGGVHGVVTDDVPILAPAGFLEHAVSENVYAGTAMNRRAVYMYGAVLDRGPAGQIGTGLGQTNSTGSISVIAPTLDITHTGQEEMIDGVRMIFQLTPGTEAPAEMNFLFPDRRALCMAENATHNLHNILTLRGALVRDARTWSRYLSEAINLFADRTDVVFASHHWPTWGRERAVGFLSIQRDLYAYLHDQTLRLLNAGYTGIEIAEMIELPPALETAWSAQGYYGSVSHNVKAIYQRYMGWFDGNPASLWELPPEQSATRYVDCMGGPDEVVSKAKGYLEDGDLRFAAQLLKHAVFADPDHAEARDLLATTFERLGHGAENGTWRNFYLMGAAELRNGIAAAPVPSIGAGMMGALSVEQLFDSIAIRIVGPKAWFEHLAIAWHLTDTDERYRMELSNGALIHYPVSEEHEADLTVTLTKPLLLQMMATGEPGGAELRGDPSVLARLLSLTESPDPDFAIVTP